MTDRTDVTEQVNVLTYKKSLAKILGKLCPWSNDDNVRDAVYMYIQRTSYYLDNFWKSTKMKLDHETKNKDFNLPNNIEIIKVLCSDEIPTMLTKMDKETD